MLDCWSLTLQNFVCENKRTRVQLLCILTKGCKLIDLIICFQLKIFFNSFERGSDFGKTSQTGYVILQKKKVLRPDNVKFTTFFFLARPDGWKKTKIWWHNKKELGRDGYRAQYFFLVRGGQEEEKKNKSFLATTKGTWARLATKHLYFIFLVRAFFRVLFGLSCWGGVQCFRKKFRYVVSFYLTLSWRLFRFYLSPFFQDFSFLFWPYLTRFRKSSKFNVSGSKELKVFLLYVLSVGMNVCK